MGAIQVSFNGKGGNTFFSSSGPVTEIAINLKGSDDLCTYRLENPQTTAVSRRMNVVLGAGKDRFVGQVVTAGFAPGTFWDVLLSGGTQRDVIDLSVQGDIAQGAAWNATLLGGANEDTLTANYAGAVDGTLRYRLEGAGDKDVLRSEVNLAGGSETIASAVDLLGGGGKDNLTLIATKVAADPANLLATINGGALKDTCSTDGSNVTVTESSC